MKTSIYTLPKISLSFSCKTEPENLIKLTTSKDVYKLLFEIWDSGRLELQEEAKVLYLNRNNRLLGYIDLSCGGIASTIIDKRLVIAPAILSGASGLLVSHNHPSLNPQPSDLDRELTGKLKECCELFGISLVDHIIITPYEYFSFADEGELN